MDWYEDDVKRLEKASSELNFEPETIFYGSSSIRLWATLDADFEGLKPVNLGFGGSTLAACDWFFDRIMAPFHPKRLVVYAGDNDLGDGRHPEEVYIFFQQLTVRVAKRFGDMPCYFVSLKPSISRWSLASVFIYANSLIEKEINQFYPNWHYVNVFDDMLDANKKPRPEFYATDGLHLTEKGYAVWKNAINKAIAGN